MIRNAAFILKHIQFQFTFELGHHVHETGDIETKTGILDGFWQIHETCLILGKPDSAYLTEILLSSNGTPGTVGRIVFTGKLNMKIFNFGEAYVFTYRFEDVPAASYHFLDLIIKSKPKDDYSDYDGFGLCSNGIMQWKTMPDSAGMLPIFIDHVNWSKEYSVPLFFDGKRFIPLGHLRSITGKKYEL